MWKIHGENDNHWVTYTTYKEDAINKLMDELKAKGYVGIYVEKAIEESEELKV
jgi:mannitol/fructose-specific phosphotransferase system IIA component (Ntr-type)